MQVKCPQCGLNKEIPDEQISSESMIVTCPRCRAQFEISRPGHAGKTRKWYAIGGLLACVLIVWFLFRYDWKLDKNYFLQPGVWQGEITYQGKKHPFELTIEHAQDGNLSGYMDWVGYSPRYRLTVRGTYVGNHLTFQDYEFLEQKGTAGLYDEKDVYIIGNEMTGTDKNGTAEFHALKRESAPF